MNRITIWSPKGGQGKTSLALAIALEFSWLVATNDTHSPIDEVLPEGEAVRLLPGEAFPEIEAGDKLIYDLGGNSEERVINAAKLSDAVIMPVIYNSPFEMQVFLEGVAEMMQINPSIILVVNGCEKGKFKSTREIITGFFPTLPIVEMRKSRAFSRVIEDGKSIGDMCKDSGLDNYHFSPVKRQLHALMQLAFKSCQPAKAAA